jgi:hypothetical protein
MPGTRLEWGLFRANRKKELSCFTDHFVLAGSRILRFRIENGACAAHYHYATTQPHINRRPASNFLCGSVRKCNIVLPVEEERHRSERRDFS